MNELIDRVKAARPDPLQLDDNELATLSAFLRTSRVSLRIMSDAARGDQIAMDEMAWRQHLAFVVEYNRRRKPNSLDYDSGVESPAKRGRSGPRANANDHATNTKAKPNSSSPRWNQWAIGLETKEKWHLFKLVNGDWRPQRLLEVPRGRQDKLLCAFAKGGGLLAKVNALKLERANYSAGEVDKLMGRIKPEISNLRENIRGAIGVGESRADPLPYEHSSQGWRAAIQIGYAVQEDGLHLGSENRLRFKTWDQLTGDEKADY